MPGLRLSITKNEPDLETFALTRGTSLGAASARDHVLLQTTGAEYHSSHFLTEKPQEITLPLPSAKWTGELFEISNRAQLMATVTRTGAAINGALCSTVSAQQSVSLQLLIVGKEDKELDHGAIPMSYSNWPAISSTLGVRDVAVVDDDGNEHEVLFTDDPVKNKRIKGAQTLLLNAYNSTNSIRSQIAYKKAPGLSKSVMRNPYGIDGSGYSFTNEVVDKPATLSDEAMEAIFKASISVEFGTPDESPDLHAEFLDPSLLGIAAAKFAENVASALSTLTAGLIPYRADGRTALLPTKLQEFPAESWSSEATRTDASDDCDGSAAFATAFIYRTRRLFATSADAKTRFPYLYALHRALAHHEVAIAVLGASAANADAADETHAKVAGHAMVLFIPRLHLVQALDRGARAVGVPEAAGVVGVEGEADITPVPTGTRPHFLSGVALSDEKLEDLRTKTLDALYPSEGGPLIDAEEFRIIQGGWSAIMAEANRFASLTTLAVEGTSAAFSRLHTPDVRVRKAATEQAQLERIVASKLSPSIAVTLKRLDATKTGRHMFYSEFVELIFATNSPLLRSRALQEAGAATAHLVLSTPTEAGTLEAGVRPDQMALNDFTAVPLSTFNRAEVDLLQEAWDEVAQNTIGRAASPMELGKEESANLDEAHAVFAALDQKLRAVPEPSEAVEVNAVFTFTGLFHNAGCTQLFADLVEGAFEAPVSGSATLHAIPDLAVDANGKNVGVFGTVRLLVSKSDVS